MQENLFWTKRIGLSEIRDPLQLAVFRVPEQWFLNGITTQTQRLRYYTFLTWAFYEIKERKSELTGKKKDLEKILALASVQHHENEKNEPKGLLSIEGTKKFLEKNSQIDVDKFDFPGYGDAFYRGPLESLNIAWNDGKTKLPTISPAGEDISIIFSESIEEIKDKIWSKTLTKPELQKMKALCFCSITIDEQNFWKKVFFGLTTSKKDGLEIDNDEIQFVITDPNSLELKKEFQKIREDDVIEILAGKIADDDDVEVDIDSGIAETSIRKTMRQGTLFLLLEIIKNSKPEVEKRILLQTIRDYIYYSPINFNKLESYRKRWEIYVHNLYYTTIFEKVLSIILDICKDNPTGIEINELVSKIDSKNFLKSIRKRGFKVSDSDNVQTVYENLVIILGGKKTKLASPINEHKLLKKINTGDKTETLGLIFVLFLLCKYRYSFFNKKELEVLAYQQNKFLPSIFPETIYDIFSKIPVTEFPGRLLKFVIERHRYVSANKYLHNTKSWLFTIDDDVLCFNQKEWTFQRYRDGKWTVVLKIMDDLGLIQMDSNKKNWEITKEGEEWLKKIQ